MEERTVGDPDRIPPPPVEMKKAPVEKERDAVPVPPHVGGGRDLIDGRGNDSAPSEGVRYPLPLPVKLGFVCEMLQGASAAFTIQAAEGPDPFGGGFHDLHEPGLPP
jgi:hypothetical protein